MRMRFLRLTVLFAPLLVLAAVVVGLPTAALGENGSRDFSARLIGVNETPSINTDGTASLRLTLNASSIDFELTYHNLTLAPVVAHIHFGQMHVAGAPMVFFCGGGGKPSCPATTSGTISGTIMASDVVGPTAQGIKPGDLGAVMRAIRAGAAYANMHTGNFPAGEIRGQIGPSNGGEHE